MLVKEALQVLAEFRREQIVVTTMGATREWSRLSDSPLDFHYLPSAMGQAPMVALGLALARPDQEIIVLNGDGSMLMNLGCLITITATAVTNLTVVVLDNGVYEVTGGQDTPAVQARVDYAQIARGAGFRTTAAYDDLECWRRGAPRMLQAAGPRFIALTIEPVRENVVPQLAQSVRDRILEFRSAIRVPTGARCSTF